jgi:hypothetical protein
MQYRFFTLPVIGDEGMEEELNVFLRSNRPISVHREMVCQKERRYWAIAVEYRAGGRKRSLDKRSAAAVILYMTDAAHRLITTVGRRPSALSRLHFSDRWCACPERTDFHKRRQAAAPPAEKMPCLRLPERQDFLAQVQVLPFRQFSGENRFRTQAFHTGCWHSRKTL